MEKEKTKVNNICTNCTYVKVNPKSKYKNPDLHCLKRANCKLTSKNEAKWCDLYTERE